MRPRTAIPAILALVVCAAGPTLAQQTDDQTGDYEEQDRRYLERFVRPDDQQQQEIPADPAAQAAAYLARADELIRDPHYRSAASDRYRVQTDDPELDPQAAVRLLDAFRGFFDEFWKGRIELAPYDEESRVFLFYSFYKFNALLEGNWRYRETRPAGHYRPAFDVITLHTDPDGRDHLPDTLVHEAAHQLIEQRIFSHGHDQPPWLTEGLASYFGYTFMDREGVFHAGEVGGKADSLTYGKPRPSAAEARTVLRSFLRTLKSAPAGDGTSFLDALGIRDPGVFYGESAPANYAASWLVVHYLMDGDEGRHRDAFIRYIEQEAGERSLFGAMGISPRGLQDAVTAHARRLQVR